MSFFYYPVPEQDRTSAKENIYNTMMQTSLSNVFSFITSIGYFAHDIRQQTYIISVCLLWGAYFSQIEQVFLFAVNVYERSEFHSLTL